MEDCNWQLLKRLCSLTGSNEILKQFTNGFNTLDKVNEFFRKKMRKQELIEAIKKINFPKDHRKIVESAQRYIERMGDEQVSFEDLNANLLISTAVSKTDVSYVEISNILHQQIILYVMQEDKKILATYTHDYQDIPFFAFLFSQRKNR